MDGRKLDIGRLGDANDDIESLTDWNIRLE